MPFTPSHAIVAIPFARTPLPAGAVAIGAMSPDLPLFFPAAPAYPLTHGFPSLLWTSLPLALVLYAVWRLLVRPAASGLLPPALGDRVPADWDAVRRPVHPIRSALLVLAAALLGVLSHVAWDLVTHPGRIGGVGILVQRVGPLPVATWLQYLSGILGLVVLGVWAVRAARRATAVPRRNPVAVRALRVATWSLAALAAVGVLGTGMAVVRVGRLGDLTDLAYFAVARLGAALAVLLLLAALAVRIARRLSPATAAVAR